MSKKPASQSPWPLRLALETVFAFMFVTLMVQLFFASASSMQGMSESDRLFYGTLIPSTTILGFVWYRLASAGAHLSSIGIAPFSFYRAARYILFYYLALFGIFAFALLLFLLLTTTSATLPPETSSTRVVDAASISLLHLLAAAIIAPITEEILFRGILFPSLRARVNTMNAAVISSLTFALLHINTNGNAIGLISIVGFSLFTCFLYRKTGSIIPGIAMHAVHNLSIITLQSIL